MSTTGYAYALKTNQSQTIEFASLSGIKRNTLLCIAVEVILR